MVMMMMSKESEKDINQRRRKKKKKKSIISQDEQQQETRPHPQTHPQRRKDLIKTKQKQQDQRDICLEESFATETQMVKTGCKKQNQKKKQNTNENL